MKRKVSVEICSVALRRPKNLPRIRYGTHSCTHAFHETPAIAPKQLVIKNHAISHRPATVGSSRGIHGRITPNPTQHTRCRVAPAMQTSFGGFHRARKEAMKICEKFPTKGRALMSPIVVFGSVNPFATSAVMNTFTGSDIVTMG